MSNLCGYFVRNYAFQLYTSTGCPLVYGSKGDVTMLQILFIYDLHL